MQKLIEKEVRP